MHLFGISAVAVRRAVDRLDARSRRRQREHLAGGGLRVVFLVAAAQSSASSFSSPAESALLPLLVAPDELLAANALNTLNNRIARLVGVPLGGVLLSSLGLEAVVLVDAISFAAAALLIAPITSPSVRRVIVRAPLAWESFWREWLEGLRLVRRDRTIALLFAVLALMTFGGTMLDPLTVAWVHDVLGEGPQVFAWILTVHAASGILGSLLVGAFGQRFAPRDTDRLGLGRRRSIARASLQPAVSRAFARDVCRRRTHVRRLGHRRRDAGDAERAGRAPRPGLRLAERDAQPAQPRGAALGGLAAELVGIVPMLNVATALIALAGLVVLRAYAS